MRIGDISSHFEHIPILKQLLELVSISIFKHLRTYVTKQDFLIR